MDVKANILWTLGAGAAVIVVLIVVAFFFAYDQGTPMTSPSPTITQVQIGSTVVQVEVADTEATRELGLSGRAGLPEGSGMLFVFDVPQRPGFWMKDMNFALDMLFVDASGKIVTIDQNIPPASYHQNPPQVFYPKAPAKYVLEVPAGFAAANGIKVGQVMAVQ